MVDADYFSRKAQLCRRLALAVPNPDDPAIRMLIEQAEEYEALAFALAGAATTGNDDTSQES